MKPYPRQVNQYWMNHKWAEFSPSPVIRYHNILIFAFWCLPVLLLLQLLKVLLAWIIKSRYRLTGFKVTEFNFETDLVLNTKVCYTWGAGHKNFMKRMIDIVACVKNLIIFSKSANQGTPTSILCSVYFRLRFPNWWNIPAPPFGERKFSYPKKEINKA